MPGVTRIMHGVSPERRRADLTLANTLTLNGIKAVTRALREAYPRLFIRKVVRRARIALIRSRRSNEK